MSLYLKNQLMLPRMGLSPATLSPASLLRVLFMISSRRCQKREEEGEEVTRRLQVSGFHTSSPSSSPVVPAPLSGNASPSPAAGAQPPPGP